MNQNKMNKNKLRDYLAMLLLCALILAYSIVLQFSIPSLVLCFGEDGHIAFEQSDKNNQCVDVDDNFSLSVNIYTNFSDQTNNCQDIPLLNVLSAFFLEKVTTIKAAYFPIVTYTVKSQNSHFGSKSDIPIKSTIIHPAIKSLHASILLI